MMKLTIFCTLIFYLSCSAVETREEQEASWNDWEGLSVTALEEHSYFKHLPIQKIIHHDGPDTWILKDESRFQTRAYCQSLGGCLGWPTYNCQHAFMVQDDIILEYIQEGSCPGKSTTEAP